MKVLILGGGASGLMAALSAAQDERNTVTVLERQSRVGRKLLATGNGRCNLTNLDLSPQHYHGQDAGFARAALSRFDGEATLEFFRALGLLTAAEPSGRVYPSPIRPTALWTCCASPRHRRACSSSAASMRRA